MFTITTQTRAAVKKGLWHCKSMTKLISVTITPLNWACCFHLQERLSSYFTFSFLQHSREGSYGLEEFHDDSEQAYARWCNRYTSCKEAIINFEKYSAKQSSIFRALSNWIFFCRGGKESDWENYRDLWEKFSYSFFLCFFLLSFIIVKHEKVKTVRQGSLLVTSCRAMIMQLKDEEIINQMHPSSWFELLPSIKFHFHRSIWIQRSTN